MMFAIYSEIIAVEGSINIEKSADRDTGAPSRQVAANVVAQLYQEAGAGRSSGGAEAVGDGGPPAPWHFLYFLPLPQGQGSLRPIFSRRTTCCGFSITPPPIICISACSRRLRRWYSRIMASSSSGVLSRKR